MAPSRLVLLRDKLDRLRRLDRKHSVFGAAAHRYEELPALHETRLATWEARHGLPLPDEMRLFYLHVHGGGPGPGYGLLELGDAPRASAPFSFSDADVAAIVERRRHDRFALLPMPDEDPDDDDWPPGGGFLHLAHLGCGTFDVLATTGDQRGRVWFCDMGFVPHYDARDGGFAQHGFFDWYERWLDQGLASLGG